MTAAVHPAQWRPPPVIASAAQRRLLAAGAVLYLLWSLGSIEVNVERVLQGLPRAGDIFARMVPPDFSRWPLLLRGMVESVQMAVAATLLGMVLSLPLGVAAASNLAPRPVYLLARGFVVLGRSFHEIIIAIFFVKIFGFGPMAGLLTLALASAVFLGKMLAEDIENMDPGQVEAVRAAGGSFGQTLVYGVVPQVLPRTLGTLIYRLDANVRHSTVIGIVGAGGIGQSLSASFSRYDYDFSLAILISIAALVAAGEVFSDRVRARLR